jgi:ABC-type antimicrobial peptide transport system permease subunit
VGDVKYHSLDEAPELDVYTYYAQTPENSLSLLLRAAPGASISAASLRQILHNLDANIPLTDVKPLSDYVGKSLAARKFLLGLLSTFSALAIVLAAVGLYAVLAYSVQQRKQEIAIRVALGAGSSDVLWIILSECLLIAIVGATVGLTGATWATSFLKSMLYGVTTTDLTAYAAAITLILVIAIAASLAPAFRAMRIDPVRALRYE